MEILESAKTKLGSEIQLIGEVGQNNVLVIGVFHGEEPQGKFLIEEYLKNINSSSKSNFPILTKPLLEIKDFGPPTRGGHEINLTKYAQKLRNNMTKEEVILWQHIRNKQINGLKFRRQEQIGKYICDFVCYEKKLIIELDGSQHMDSSQDKDRDSFLQSQGFTILRFWNNEICNNLQGVLDKIYIMSSPRGRTEIFDFEEGAVLSPQKNRNNLLFIPCLNPDGMAENKRTNANNVDLNRNFPTKNWELTEKNEFFGGNEPSSEVETRFVIDIIEKYKPKMILTLHAPYKIVNYDGPAKEIAEKISEIIGYPVEASIGYPTPGSFGTYCGVERNIPTITLELDENIPVQDLLEPVHKIFDLLNNL